MNKKIKIVNKYPEVTIDPALDKYQGKILFPKKLALANEILNRVGVPKEAQ